MATLSNEFYETTPPTSPIERLDSGDTVDSAFSSNLVTPSDEHGHPTIGIEQRFDEANTILDYFAKSSFGKEKERVNEVIQSTESEQDDVVEIVATSDILDNSRSEESGIVSEGDSQKRQGYRSEQDEDTSALISLESIQSLPSPLPSASELRVAAQARRSSIYSLPNTHISVEEKLSSELDSDIEEPHTDAEDDRLTLRESTQDLLFSHSWPEDIKTLNLTLNSLITLSIRTLCFIPWCIAIGGSIFLFPTHISDLAFSPYLAYLSPPPPNSPIHCFAHWAEYGLQHATIFLGFVLGVLIMFPNAGWVALGAVLGQFCWAWHDFLEDQTVSLGEDDRQTFYILAKTTWTSGYPVQMKEVDGRFYASNCGSEDTGIVCS